MALVCNDQPASPERKALTVDQRLQKLMQELGEAINESISDSDQIAEVIAKIKTGGYDVFLVLEATIGFNRRDEEASPSLLPPLIPAMIRNCGSISRM